MTRKVVAHEVLASGRRTRPARARLDPAAHSVALFRALMLVSVLTYCFIAWINVHSAWTAFRHANGPLIAISAIAATIYIGAFLLISLWRLGLRVVQRKFRLRDWLPDAILALPAIVAMTIVWRGTL